MEKGKRWHLWLIVAVLALTAYNILPTIFFYVKPLDKPVGAATAEQVAGQISERVNALEGEAVSWVNAYARNLGLKPDSVSLVEGSPDLIAVKLPTAANAAKFRKFLPRAGALIPFAPAQLQVGTATPDQPTNVVIVERAVAAQLAPSAFTFSEKFDADGSPNALYQTITSDRMVEVGLAVGGESTPARLLRFNPSGDAIVVLAGQIVEYEKVFGLESPLTQRYYASFTQSPQPGELVSTLKRGLRAVSNRLEEEIAKANGGAEEGASWSQNVRALRRQRELLDRAADIVDGHTAMFEAGAMPLTSEAIAAAGDRVDLGNRNPFFESLALDWDQEKMVLEPHADLRAIRGNRLNSELAAFRAEKLDQLLVNEVAEIGRETDEQVRPEANGFAIALNALTGSESFTVLDLKEAAAQRIADVERRLKSAWSPTSADLGRANFPIWDYATYTNLPADQKQLGLVVYAPVMEKGAPRVGFRESSIYVIANGLRPIAEKGQGSDQSALMADVEALDDLLKQQGFVSFMDGNDLIFQLDNYYADLLAATREKFEVHGTKRYAVLEYTDQKQRLLTLNAIETAQHEDLVKWRDEYHSAKVNPELNAKYDVPPPTKSVLWSNLGLSAKKYFRGDDRKVLNWGLDLSGGKTVTIGLVDQRNRAVTNPADIRQGINELTNRVNKMGVSEVEVRQEGNNIVLNFPGAQGLSASELIKASTMTFHIVNEQFGLQNAALAGSVSRFLQEVWNEAVVTGRNSIDQINEIAYQQLGGSDEEEGLLTPRSEAAQTLWDAGLRLADPQLTEISSAFNDELSAVAMWRGDSYAEWQGQPNPLMFVFANYALEGPNLENVHAEYDPSKGNMLVFGVTGSATSPDGFNYNPRDEFYTWTSQFAKSQISGTPKASYSRDGGWRMAGILNGEVISAPTLNDALRSNAQVTGHFSQREVNQLVADLKAGSLSFTPKILSEKNVSPDLGKQERTQGIVAAIVGLLLVIGGMAWYYRFAGVIAGCAVVINLLIIWGVLQNLDAALTLPGIAGIILTVGMAVDANVLVFERIREEFAVSKRIASAVSAGYKKAFSAIVDSNITTILAAFILLHFDAGPIKAFAVTIIIGIISSMFTALFMTRYFFAGWVQKPKNTELKMVNLFHQTKFDFLGKAKIAITAALIVIVAGCGLLWMQRQSMFGMDFTGGYALNVTVEEQAGVNYRADAIAALTEAGAPSGDVLIRQLNRPNQLRIQLGRGLEQSGRPFYGMPQETSADGAVFLYETNPRIVWTVDALATAGLQVSPDQLPTLQNQWNVISGQFSDTMRNSAIWGLGLALLSILIYITIRFEFKYAVSAIVALAHDVLITVGAMAILHKLGVGVQIDLQVVGALMTIVGYSLNDTIVIFDRVREDSRVLRKLKFSEMVNSALNSTLNRTLITSGTTLLVLIALVLFGGSAIFDFALVMTMGVVFGTFSSLFIASPVLLFFHKREMAREEQVTGSAKRA